MENELELNEVICDKCKKVTPVDEQTKELVKTALAHLHPSFFFRR